MDLLCINFTWNMESPITDGIQAFLFFFFFHSFGKSPLFRLPLFFLFFFLAAPKACGISRARDQTHATEVTTPGP